MPTSAITAALVILIPGVWIVWTFNRLVRLRNTQREAWSGIDVQLGKRHNLVPALVECVRGYQAHERGTFQDLASLRTASESASVVAAAENQLTGRLRGLFAVAEAYPELKADENFRQLSAQLIVIEDDLQYARRYYNGAVRDFRNATETFPSNLIASAFRFGAGDFFEVETVSERDTPGVKL